MRLVTGYRKDGGVESRAPDIQDSNVYNPLVC